MVTPITTLFMNWFNTKRTYIWVGIFVLFLAAAVVYVYTQMIMKNKIDWSVNVPNLKPHHKEGGGNVYIYFFTVDWCPHCIKAKIPWQNFVDKYNNKKIHGSTIICREMNATVEDDTREEIIKVKLFKVKGYPTVIMVKGEDDKNPIDFDAQISLHTLEKFVEDMV
jgi:thiol-disulfide isomerase/thioredoxin